MTNSSSGNMHIVKSQWFSDPIHTANSPQSYTHAHCAATTTEKKQKKTKKKQKEPLIVMNLVMGPKAYQRMEQYHEKV